MQPRVHCLQTEWRWRWRGGGGGEGGGEGGDATCGTMTFQTRFRATSTNRKQTLYGGAVSASILGFHSRSFIIYLLTSVPPPPLPPLHCSTGSFEKEKKNRQEMLGSRRTRATRKCVQASAFMTWPRVYEQVCGVRSTPPVFLLLQAFKKKKKEKKRGRRGGGFGSRGRKKMKPQGASGKGKKNER